MTIYELKENWKQVAEMLYEEEVDEKCVLDTLESIEGEIEDKADGYAKIIKELEYLRDSRKLESKRLNENANVLDNRIKFLKNNLFNVMKETGKTKFNTELFAFNICKNGGKQALTIDGEVPEEFTKIVVENDTDKIREVLESGENLPFAHLEPRGESLRIK